MADKGVDDQVWAKQGVGVEQGQMGVGPDRMGSGWGVGRGGKTESDWGLMGGG